MVKGAVPVVPAQRRRRARGVALLVLMLLLAVMSVVIADVVHVGAAAARRQSEEELQFVGLQYRQALVRYAALTPPGAARAPRRLEDLLRDPRQPGIVRHLRRLYPDPMSGRLDWVLVRDPAGGIVALHSASPLRPLKSTGFVPELRALEGEKASYADWVFGP